MFGTNDGLAIPMPGIGSAGVATCFVNLVEPGDSVFVLTNGRMGHTARPGNDDRLLDVLRGM